ncbi:DarT ssDNA thymidine ADP-ribosyltransferase family protein [Curtobacterium sp. 9128]|uniref:DarT ssDNA thymidine ADP-ribosyltransferase family protein n=1 Tax=Curtobacterium sp. 9128 TaxID=1793722 RepID=UPI00119ED896|nr:DarT ssDNA thymidine ADP-ribosyltransferase family protein [Curtobacterium sp. 9128]
MTDECIHGFPTELCDICAPRQREVPDVPKVPAPRRTRVSTSLRSTPGGSPARAKATALRTVEPEMPAPRRFGTLRAHHVTHIDNFDGIVADGAILASDAVTPSYDISAPTTRQARAAATAPDGSSVAGHVPFSLSPDSARWDEVRRGALDTERWSDAARQARATDYVVLVIPTAAFGASVILADKDADAEDVRFAVGPEAAANLLRRTDLTDPEMHGLEVLAGPSVPFSSVAVIGVPNDRARHAVKDILAEHGGHVPRVAVFPPWFVPPVVPDED